MMANEMRDRLVELLKDSPMLDVLYAEDDEWICVADHLIENGVVVPPCKVGDTVYFNKAEIGETCPAKVIGIYNNFFTPSMPLWITIEYESSLIGRQEERMTTDVFELLCHYSKEQAEQKLKEMRGGDE